MYMYNDIRSYIFTIIADVMGNKGAHKGVQIQLVAYFNPYITQFKLVSVCADKEHHVSCSNLFVNFIILVLDPAFS